jgi:hypothetical protein
MHFIGLNSNLIFPFSSTVEQIDFIRRDMAIAANQKRWVVAFLHESPYTIVSSAILRPFINVFDEVGVDLVLNGHHHCYSRSNKMGGIPTILHFDGNINDTALKVWTAGGGAVTSTAQKKFGTASLLLDGVAGYITTPQMGDFAFASYPFTIDFWVNCGPQAKIGATIFGNGVPTLDATARYIKVDASGHVVFCPGRGETLTSTSSITNNTWRHVAITRAGNTLRLYIDGVREATATTTGDVDFSLNNSFIGKNGWDGTNGFFAGYIDEFHVIKKVPKWTTDTSFAPPTAAYSATLDTDTVITDPNVPGCIYFMLQATGYKMLGKTVPATTAPWRADYDGRTIHDPMYNLIEVTWNQITLNPYLLTQIMPLEDNVGRDVIRTTYHTFSWTKP